MMAAKSRSEKNNPPPARFWRYARLGLLLLLIILFLGGLVGAGRWGLEQLRGRDRYVVPFADIECDPPVGMDRPTFLGQVRYTNRFPEHVNLLDEDLPHKLRKEFAGHAWVERVDDVEITPPKRIAVKLTHRVPVLAVKVGGTLRAVDGVGVLLPTNAPTLGLPVYDGEASPPRNPAGARWGDPNVEAAARKLRK